MEEQELRDFCIQALKKIPIPQNEQKRAIIAKDFADRLFITNYFSKENRTNFIKNELCSHFKLTDEQTSKIIKEIDFKEAVIQDKLQIKKFKGALKELSIFEYNSFFRCNNISEVKKIVEYIRINYTFNNQDMLKEFIRKDLCKHFELTDEEQKEVMKEV